MEYKIQHAQKCLYCGKYLLCNEQVGTYTHGDMKDWLGHVECANLHLIENLEKRVKNIITKEPYLSFIEIVEIEADDVVPAIQPTYVTEYDTLSKPTKLSKQDKQNTIENTVNKTKNNATKSDIIDLTNDEMDVL